MIYDINNKHVILDVLDDLNNANVDYRITCLKNNGEIPSKIRIYINEKDLGKFISICEKYGLIFIDRRNNPKRKISNGIVTGESDINASDNNFNIDAQGYERLSDNSIITKDNFVDNNGNHCIKADYYHGALAKELFDSDMTTINGNSYPIVAPEFDYISRLNSSDSVDIEVVDSLKSVVDKERISKIQALAADNYANQITKANSNINENHDNLQNEINNDLSSMLADDSPIIEAKDTSIQKEKPKQFIKTNNINNNGDNGGYISKLSFIFFMLLIIVLLLVGFLLLNM